MLRLLLQIKSMRISLRLTLVYGSIMVMILLFTSFLTGIGIYYSMYHQAEIEMGISIHHVVQVLQNNDRTEIIGRIPQTPLPERMSERKERDGMNGMSRDDHAPDYEKPAEDEIPQAGGAEGEKPHRGDLLMPGVVLRVTDADGRIVYETDELYPSIAEVESHVTSRPIWMESGSMQIAAVRNMVLCYETIDFEYDDQVYKMHFFRTVTAERHFLQMLQKILVLTNVIGLLLALITGHFVSRRILQPIRTITTTARRIQVSDLDQRIEVPPTRDEVAALAKTFNLMLDRLQDGFELQRRFVSDASHELRTPVTVIHGYSEILSRWGRQNPETLDESIAAIHSETENMQKLIDKLLFLARADQKRQALHKEMTDMQELVDDVAEKMKIIAKKHEVQLGKNDDGMAYVDPVTIKQMMRIFLDNAMKYTPEGGHIRISSTHRNVDGKQVLCIEIADDGIGIAKENQQKVFERFYRVDSSRAKGQGGADGTGLGLSIARWIADQHNIAIAMESELGKGTTIRLTVPLSS